MNSFKNIKYGIKAKHYGIKYFNGRSLTEKREEWIKNNPEVIIINSQILYAQDEWHQIIEYYKQ